MYDTNTHYIIGAVLTCQLDHTLGSQDCPMPEPVPNSVHEVKLTDKGTIATGDFIQYYCVDASGKYTKAMGWRCVGDGTMLGSPPVCPGVYMFHRFFLHQGL